MKGDKAGKSGDSSSGDIFSAHAFDLDIKLGQVLALRSCVLVLDIYAYMLRISPFNRLSKGWLYVQQTLFKQDLLRRG